MLVVPLVAFVSLSMVVWRTLWFMMQWYGYPITSDLTTSSSPHLHFLGSRRSRRQLRSSPFPVLMSCGPRPARASKSWWVFGRFRRGGACDLVCSRIIHQLGSQKIFALVVMKDVGRKECSEILNDKINQDPEGPSGFVDGNCGHHVVWWKVG